MTSHRTRGPNVSLLLTMTNTVFFLPNAIFFYPHLAVPDKIWGLLEYSYMSIVTINHPLYENLKLLESNKTLHI